MRRRPLVRRRQGAVADVGGGGRGGQGGGGGQATARRSAGAAGSDTSDRWADQTRIDGSRRFVTHRFPLLKDAPVAQTHSCHYESTSSSNSSSTSTRRVERVDRRGRNAEGFKFSLKIGDYVANRVMGHEDLHDKLFKIPENISAAAAGFHADAAR